MILPKRNEQGNYLSYSQYDKWKKSKKDYIKSYFFGERFEGNAYTDLGSLVGEALENNNFSEFSISEKKTLKKVTRLDEFEREIKLVYKDFSVIGYIDTNDKELSCLIDYKTGALDKEAVYKANTYEQLVIYAAAIEQETGKLPKTAHVELIERLGNPYKGDKLTVGKSVIKIPQNISKRRVNAVKKKLETVAKEISNYYKVFNKLNSI